MNMKFIFFPLVLLPAIISGRICAAQEITGIYPVLEADGHAVVSVSLTVELYGPALADAKQVHEVGSMLPKDAQQRLPEDLVVSQNEAIKSSKLEEVLSLYDEQSRPEVAKQFASIGTLSADRKGADVRFFSRQYYCDFVMLQDVIETTTYGKIPWIDMARMRNGTYALTTVLPRSGFVTTMFSAAQQAHNGELKQSVSAAPTEQKTEDGDVVNITDIVDVIFDSEARKFSYRKHKDPVGDAASLRLKMVVFVQAAILRKPFDASTDQTTDPYLEAIVSAYQEALRLKSDRLAFSDESAALTGPPKARGIAATIEDVKKVRGYLALDSGRAYLCGEEGSISKFIYLTRKDATSKPTLVANPFGNKTALFKLFNYDNGMRGCLTVVCSDALAHQ